MNVFQLRSLHETFQQNVQTQSYSKIVMTVLFILRLITAKSHATFLKSRSALLFSEHMATAAGRQKNCLSKGRNFGADPGSRWAAICMDWLGQ